MPKDIFPFSTMWTDVVTHVLDDAKDRHFHLAKHRNASLDIEQRDILRSAHNHPAVERNFLRKSQGRISGAWRQINDEIIQLSPNHITQKLTDDPHNNRSTPNDR